MINAKQLNVATRTNLAQMFEELPAATRSYLNDIHAQWMAQIEEAVKLQSARGKFSLVNFHVNPLLLEDKKYTLFIYRLQEELKSLGYQATLVSSTREAQLYLGWQEV